MVDGIFGWVRGMIDAYERQDLVGSLHRLSDPLLDDIGLRRDQLDVLLLSPAKPVVAQDRRVAQPAVRPALQGCG